MFINSIWLLYTLYMATIYYFTLCILVESLMTSTSELDLTCDINLVKGTTDALPLGYYSGALDIYNSSTSRFFGILHNLQSSRYRSRLLRYLE